MRPSPRSGYLAVALLFGLSAGVAQAGPLQDRIDAGDTIRIGFANEVPWAFPGDNGAPDGFVNAYVIGVLKEMGYENVEAVVTEWGGLIPGLQAGRFDIITGGMFITGKRCANVAFSQPMAKISDAFIVQPGNPKNINTMEDVRDSNAIMVTGAGYNSIGVAKEVGVPDSNIMQVPGPTEILAAVRAGRADAGAATYFTAQNLAKEANGAVEVSDVSKQPTTRMNWVGIGFRPNDGDFREAFDAAQKTYLGTDAMLASVEPFGYGESALPDDKTTDWVCANR